MKLSDVKTIAIVAAVGGGIYLVYRLLGGAKSAVAAVTCKPVTALANWYAALTSSGAAVPTGMVLLPSGQAVPVSQLQVSPVPGGGNAAQFNYGGATYYLTSPHDSAGNWVASSSLNCAPASCAWTCCAPLPSGL